jgi:hypothetical protein
MEPNNFEKDFREKLNQRKIEPSSKAWDRLDAMLTVAEEKKPKRKNKWLYIAASIVGFLLLGTFFFNQKKTVETPKNEVVIEGNNQKSPDVKPDFNAIDSTKEEAVISEKEPNLKSENSNNKVEVLNEKPNQTIKNETNQIAESSVINQKNQQTQSGANQISVSEMPKNETTEQLLTDAEKLAVAQSSAKPKAKIKINANDLLNQVDGELELSFREKVITKVNKNYQTVKVALANRNQKE